MTVFDQVAIIDFQLGPDNTLVQFSIRKGQLISKCLFGAFNSSKKTNEKKSDLASKTSEINRIKAHYYNNFSVRFLVELKARKFAFEIF